ncbi:hypothetical protein Taro_034676 [Colocasia esculenta]|uniref:CCHC-type domain-containing protein n=1 Tax=Colocasia esculenta TaxID=4460 RepID=A0A843W3K8_COLES|nr:hypothetical protein [Colocasia esculenta]
MVSHGRRGAQAREDEQRCEERGEQQVPASQGPTVLPPPPPMDYGVFMQGLIQAMQTQAQMQAALQAQLQAQALSAACRQMSKMDQYMEEKRAAQKRSAPPFQRQDKKKVVVYQSPQHPVAAPSQQAVVLQSPNFRPSDKKMCPHCGRAHGSTECWKLAGKCLKCGSIEHQIRDCPRLQ